MAFHVNDLHLEFVTENNFVVLREEFVQREVEADVVFPLQFGRVEEFSPFAAIELADNFGEVAGAGSFSQDVEGKAGGVVDAMNFRSAEHELVIVDYAELDGVGKALVAKVAVLLLGVELEIKTFVESHHTLKVILSGFLRDVNFVSVERDLKIVVVVAQNFSKRLRMKFHPRRRRRNTYHQQQNHHA